MQPELLSLPACLNRSTAFVVFALAIFMVAAHTGIAAIAAQRTSLSAKGKTIIPFVVAAFLASWLAIAILVGDGPNFPIPLESRRASSGLVALIPFLIAVIALFASKNLRDQYSNAERLADRHSNLPHRRYYVRLALSYVWNFARRICLACWNRRRINWNLCAHRGVDARVQPASCVEVGGRMESFWHARSDRCSGNGVNFSGARPRHLSACARAIVSRATDWNSHSHFIVQKSRRYQVRPVRDSMIQSGARKSFVVSKPDVSCDS